MQDRVADNDNAKSHSRIVVDLLPIETRGNEPEAREQLISSARYGLGRVLNALNRFRFELK